MNKKLLLALAVFGATSVQAATLTTDYEISVVAVNGQLITKEQKIDDTHIQLPDGNTQLIVEVDGLFKDGKDSEFFSSKPYVITFDSSQDAVLEMPKYVKSYKKVKSTFSGKTVPQWRLSSASGTEIAYTTELLPGKKGFLPYGDLEAVIASYNSSQGIIFEDNNAKDLEELTVSVDEKGKVDVKGDNLTQLKLWYTKASKKEKKAFRHWMLDQDM